MIDELAIYNLVIKYPNTIDLIREVEKMAKAEAIKEYHDKLSKEMHDLWKFYKADTNNRPKPDFLCAYSMVDLIAEQLKAGGKNDD